MKILKDMWVIKVIEKVKGVMFEFCIAFKMCTNVEWLEILQIHGTMTS